MSEIVHSGQREAKPLIGPAVLECCAACYFECRDYALMRFLTKSSGLGTAGVALCSAPRGLEIGDERMLMSLGRGHRNCGK